MYQTQKLFPLQGKKSKWFLLVIGIALIGGTIYSLDLFTNSDSQEDVSSDKSSTGENVADDTEEVAESDCDCTLTCSEFDTYDDAVFQLKQCGCEKLDANQDGIPCESVFGIPDSLLAEVNQPEESGEQLKEANDTEVQAFNSGIQSGEFDIDLFENKTINELLTLSLDQWEQTSYSQGGETWEQWAVTDPRITIWFTKFHDGTFNLNQIPTALGLKLWQQDNACVDDQSVAQLDVVLNAVNRDEWQSCLVEEDWQITQAFHADEYACQPFNQVTVQCLDLGEGIVPAVNISVVPI